MNEGASGGRSRFPSREAFDAYRVDPELLEMSNLRAACILRTEVSLHQE